MDLCFCYSKDHRRQQKFLTDPTVVRRVADHFIVIYLDLHGQSFILKEDFGPGLVEFFR